VFFFANDPARIGEFAMQPIIPDRPMPGVFVLHRYALGKVMLQNYEARCTAFWETNQPHLQSPPKESFQHGFIVSWLYDSTQPSAPISNDVKKLIKDELVVTISASKSIDKAAADARVAFDMLWKSTWDKLRKQHKILESYRLQWLMRFEFTSQTTSAASSSSSSSSSSSASSGLPTTMVAPRPRPASTALSSSSSSSSSSTPNPVSSSPRKRKETPEPEPESNQSPTKRSKTAKSTATAAASRDSKDTKPDRGDTKSASASASSSSAVADDMEDEVYQGFSVLPSSNTKPSSTKGSKKGKSRRRKDDEMTDD
jgi:hypothetical protein